MDIYSFTVPKNKEGKLAQIEQFVASASATFRTTSTKDGTIFNMRFEVAGTMKRFKNELRARFPDLYK